MDRNANSQAQLQTSWLINSGRETHQPVFTRPLAESDVLWGSRTAVLAQHLACSVACLVKNQPAMWETWVQFLGWEDSPGEGNSYTLQYCCLENCMDRASVGYNPWGHRFKYDWVTFTSVHFIMHTTTWDILCTRIYNCPEVNLEGFVGACLGLLEPISMCGGGLLTDK